MKSPKEKRQELNRLFITNVVLISVFAFLLANYSPLIFTDVKYAAQMLFDQNVKEAQTKKSDLPKRVKAGQEVLYAPINKISKPVDPAFSIIIPKVGINKKVVPQVDLSNDKEVFDALTKGVGWAKGTVEPGSYGNSLIFGHSTRNLWNIFKYNSEFSLLEKLELDDTFTVVYQGRQYDYIVFEKKIVLANDTSYLTSVAEGSIVTLQTCYPRGSDTHRLLIRGRLVAMEIK